MPKNGILFKRACVIAVILPLTPSSPNPPGINIESTLSNALIPLLSNERESIHLIDNFTLL